MRLGPDASAPPDDPLHLATVEVCRAIFHLAAPVRLIEMVGVPAAVVIWISLGVGAPLVCLACPSWVPALLVPLLSLPARAHGWPPARGAIPKMESPTARSNGQTGKAPADSGKPLL